MKTTILAVLALHTAIAAAAASAQADADFTMNCNDCMVTRLTCRQASEGIDSGLLVSISSGGFAGVTMAAVSEQSIAGPRQLGQVIVDVQADPGLLTFDGQRFSLVVNRAEENDGLVPARLRAEINGRLITDDFVCRQLQ